MPFERAGEATREVLLGRPLGQVDEEARTGRDEETPLGQGFVPGDLARIEVGVFQHEMNLKEVVAFFEHEDDTERAIALRGEPQETDPPAGGTKFSGVSLRAIVLADALPGIYRFRQLEAETYGAKVTVRPEHPAEVEALAFPGTRRTRYAAFDLTTYGNLEFLELVASDARRPQTVAGDNGGVEPHPSPEETQEAAQPRPERSWWRRIFEG